MSFDILCDSLGGSRTEYPLTAYLVAGTQAEVAKQNLIILMKMSQLQKTEQEGRLLCVSIYFSVLQYLDELTDKMLCSSIITF